MTTKLSLVLCLAAGVLALIHHPYHYVERVGATWFVLAGAVVAVVALLAARTAAQRTVGLLLATMLLLPSGGALLIIHGLRLVGAIPMPLDVISAVVSVIAGITVIALWATPNPLRPKSGSRFAVPGWVAIIGIVASLAYPTFKVSWAIGSPWLAPAGAVGVIDATFVATTALSLAAVPALVIALSWWNRPAPRWARPAALTGGMVLSALGASGLWSVPQSADGVASGLIVYGSWLVWGLCTIATSGRLTARLADAGHSRSLIPHRSLGR